MTERPQRDQCPERPDAAERKVRSTAQRLRDMVPPDMKALVHELETHQTELEMQNEELRRVRQDLEASRRQYADLYDFAPIGYLLLDRNGVIRSSNFAGARILGCSQHGLAGLRFSIFIEEQDRESLFRHLREVFEGQGRHIQELRVRAVDDSVLHVQLQSVVAKETGSEPATCRVAIVDITERKTVEQALEESSEHLRARTDDLVAANEQLLTQQEEVQGQTLELHELRDQAERTARKMQWLASIPEESPDLVLHVSAAGEISYRNLAASELCRRWNRDSELEVPPPVREMIDAARAGMEIVRREMTFGGQTYLLTAKPAPAGYVNIYGSDITERKRAEEALRELNATLESKVAHRTAQLQRRTSQLQTLTLELSQAEDRERKRLAEVLHDDLQQVIAGAKFHLNLIRDQVKCDASLYALALETDQMLKDAIAKSRSLSHELSPAALYQGDFGEALRWLADQMQAKHGLTVHVHVHDHVNVPSDTMKSSLYKVTRELLFNVVKHAQVAEAKLRLRRLGRRIFLSVSDRGRGFDVQELGQAPGVGLLSIRERIELLGGRMKIRSTIGKGSTFLIEVPEGELPRAEQESDDRGGSRDFGRLRVLLADDHAIVREGLVSLLGGEPSVEIVGEAANGREAVALAGQLQPDVVIMDVAMPIMAGDEATRKIKEHLPKTRVVALSMSEDRDAVVRMRQAGADSYVLKTAPFGELLAAIRGEGAGNRR